MEESSKISGSERSHKNYERSNEKSYEKDLKSDQVESYIENTHLKSSRDKDNSRESDFEIQEKFPQNLPQGNLSQENSSQENFEIQEKFPQENFEIQEKFNNFDIKEPNSNSISTTTASKTVTKSPFQPKNTTVRRDAKDVYPKKGLHKLQSVGTSPLDRLFHDLDTKLTGQLHELSIEVLCERFHVASRYELIKVLLESLLQIQSLSETPSTSQKSSPENLIKISLHDIKTFSKLFNVILVHGIYPVLSMYDIGIPIEKRSIKDFGSNKQITVDRIQDLSDQHALLRLIFDKLLQVFTTESDVRDLLTKGTGMSDFLTVTITLISMPCFKEQGLLSTYRNTIVTIPETYELFQTYSLLVASGTSQRALPFKQFVMSELRSLPTKAPRGDGVSGLIEFVLGMRENDEINIDKFDHVASVIVAKPKEIPTREYFASLGSQFYDILVNINKHVMTSCVCHVLEQLWVRNKLIVRDFFAVRLWGVFQADPSVSESNHTVSEIILNNGINVLVSVTLGHISADLLEFLFEPVVMPVWACYTFMKEAHKPANVLQNILVNSLTTLSESGVSLRMLEKISKNILWESDWEYAFGPNGLLCIQPKSILVDTTDKMQKFLSKLDSNADYFVELLGSFDDDQVHRLFVALLSSWLKDQNEKASLEKKSSLTSSLLETNPYVMLMDLQLLQKIGTKFSDILARTPLEMLQIVHEFLDSTLVTAGSSGNVDSDDADSDDEDDADLLDTALPVILELLSAIMSESDNLDIECKDILRKIQGQLLHLAKSAISSTLATSSQALHDRIGFILEKDHGGIELKKELDTKTLKRAVASLNDPLVPIRAHGLHMLRTLIQNKSEVLSLDFVINLHLVQLNDSEPFIYLNVIKGLESLLIQDQSAVLGLLLKLYIGTEESVDTRLKIGEVLLRYIQSANELFSGESASQLVTAMVSMVRVSTTNKVDMRLRMSSMSLLGTCCKTNPIGFVGHLNEVLDCAVGILQMEVAKDEAVMRRAAAVLIHDLIIGTSNTSVVAFPQEYRQKVYDVLRYVLETDNDPLVREQARIVLSTIHDLAKIAFEEAAELN